MYGPHHPDWSRFEREMRVWGRRFERDMRKMGEEMDADTKESGEGLRRACRPGSGFFWTHTEEQRRHAEQFARRAAERAAASAARAASRGAARSAARSARAAGRSAERGARCGSGIWAWWWLAFPLFFIGKNSVEEWGGPGVIADGLTTWWMNLSLAAPLARLVSAAIGVSFQDGFALLALAGAVAAGAAVIGWRVGRPRDLSQPS